MDSFQEGNPLTRNRTQWVQFMNRSTQDWGIGYLPPNLFAILGQLNDSFPFPDDALVVEYAGQTHVGGSEIEVFVFGITAAIVLIFIFAWAILTWKVFGFLPPASSRSNDSGMMTAEKFTKQLDEKYYENLDTCLEIFDPDDKNHTSGNNTKEALKPEEVEEVTALLRKMYGFDLSVWAKGSGELTEADLNHIRNQSDAAWAEIQAKIERWKKQRSSMNSEERAFFDGVVAIVKDIGTKRS